MRIEHIDVTEDPDDIVNEFKTRFVDTERFFDKYARGKFARYLISRHANPTRTGDQDAASRLVEESQLFIEAAHACEARLANEAPAAGGVDLEIPANA